jgi:hypothetical protein
MNTNNGALKVGQNYEATEDFPADMTGEEGAADEVRRQEAMQQLGATFAKQRDEWIAARRASGWDKRIAEDLDQYHAKDNNARQAAAMMESVEQGFPVTQNHSRAARSTVYIGLTRQKSNAAEARLSDILLPTDENNWGVQPTPKPELARMMLNHEPAVDPETGGPLMLDVPDPQTGEPVKTEVKKSDVAMAAETVAREASKNMEREIEDQLTECDYNAETRKVLHDGAVMGTGVIKGPITMNRTRKSWQPITGPDGKPAVNPETGSTVYEMVFVEEKKPASYHVDPRFVWEDPDCGDDVQNGKGIYELEHKTRKKVRELFKQPGYLKDQLAQVLEEGPQRSPALVELTAENQRGTPYEKNTFDVWTYTGEMDPEDLRLCGCDVPEDEEDGVSGCIVMINDTVVKAYLNPIESGDLPYDFYPWEKVNDSPRGYGVPYLMRSPQRVINAAWRMMMDNAAICAGPQIIVKKGKIEPEDRTWTLYARKVWIFNGTEGESVTDAFTQVEFNMHQAELSAIIQLGIQLADAETSTPMITQGEQGSAPETVGGMQMLLNSANVVLRRLVKQFDDYVTKRHIRRYYDYNMAYSEDDSIKGDFSVDARGSSALLVRDIQNQAFTNLLAAGSNPTYAMFIDQKKLFEKALQAQHVQPQDIMKTDAQIKSDMEAASKNAPQDPRVQVAMIRAQSESQTAEALNAAKESEIALRREIAVSNDAAKLMELQLKRDLAMLQYAETQKLTLMQVKAQLAETAINNRTKAELAAQERELKLDPANTDNQGI